MKTTEAQQKEFRKRLAHVLKKPENKICSDCPQKRPSWGALVLPPQNAPHGSNVMVAFVCFSCAASHRNLGSHISVVRSLTMDDWDEFEVTAAERSGNKKVNYIYEGGLSGSSAKPLNGAHQTSRDRFVRAKYAEQSFYDKAAHSKHVERENKRKESKSSSKRRGSLIGFINNKTEKDDDGGGTKSIGPQTVSTAPLSETMFDNSDNQFSSYTAAHSVCPEQLSAMNNLRLDKMFPTQRNHHPEGSERKIGSDHTRTQQKQTSANNSKLKLSVTGGFDCSTTSDIGSPSFRTSIKNVPNGDSGTRRNSLTNHESGNISSNLRDNIPSPRRISLTMSKPYSKGTESPRSDKDGIAGGLLLNPDSPGRGSVSSISTDTETPSAESTPTPAKVTLSIPASPAKNLRVSLYSSSTPGRSSSKTRERGDDGAGRERSTSRRRESSRSGGPSRRSMSPSKSPRVSSSDRANRRGRSLTTREKERNARTESKDRKTSESSSKHRTRGTSSTKDRGRSSSSRRTRRPEDGTSSRRDKERKRESSRSACPRKSGTSHRTGRSTSSRRHASGSEKDAGKSSSRSPSSRRRSSRDPNKFHESTTSYNSTLKSPRKDHSRRHRSVSTQRSESKSSSRPERTSRSVSRSRPKAPEVYKDEKRKDGKDSKRSSQQSRRRESGSSPKSKDPSDHSLDLSKHSLGFESVFVPESANGDKRDPCGFKGSDRHLDGEASFHVIAIAQKSKSSIGDPKSPTSLSDSYQFVQPYEKKKPSASETFEKQKRRASKTKKDGVNAVRDTRKNGILASLIREEEEANGPLMRNLPDRTHSAVGQPGSKPFMIRPTPQRASSDIRLLRFDPNSSRLNGSLPCLSSNGVPKSESKSKATQWHPEMSVRQIAVNRQKIKSFDDDLESVAFD